MGWTLVILLWHAKPIKMYVSFLNREYLFLAGYLEEWHAAFLGKMYKKILKPFLKFQDSALRCLADSNRRRRFCRPLTKPLIQGTVPCLRMQR